MWGALPLLACLAGPFRTATDRPALSGPELVVPSDDGLFLVHYTLEGDDAVQGAIADDGVPELVHRALDGLALGVSTFEDRQYRALIGDDGEGGSEAIDVYLSDLDINGYAYPLPAGADGPGCYLQLDNALTLDPVMQSVAVHELHHCVQFRYTTQTHAWLYEATATYEQYRTLLDLTLEAAVIVLWSRRLEAPDLPMDFTDGAFEYAGMVAMLFWEQFGGTDPQRIPDLWEALALEPDWPQALDNEAQRLWNISWKQAYSEYTTWNALACANDDGAHYDDDALPCNPFISVPYRQPKWAGGEVQVRVRLDPSYDSVYVQLPDDAPDADLAVDCEAPGADTELSLRILSIDDANGIAAQRDAVASTEPLSLRMPTPRGGTSIRAIASNTGAGALDVRCAFRQLPPEDEVRACGCQTTGTAPWWLPFAIGFSLRRRARGDRRHSSSSCRSSPR